MSRFEPLWLAGWVQSPALGSHETPAWDLQENKNLGLSPQSRAGTQTGWGSPIPTHPPLPKRGLADASLPRILTKSLFPQRGLSALTSMGSTQGLRVKWKFRLSSRWPKPRTLLPVKPSPRPAVGASPLPRGPTAPRPPPHAARSCFKSLLVVDLPGFYRELKDFGRQRGLCKGNNPSSCKPLWSR